MSKVAQIWTVYFNFRGHLSTFGAKNTLKRGHFIIKKILKHFLNNAKATLKKASGRLFPPDKWPKHGCQLGKKGQFLGPFSIYKQ